MGKKSGLVPNLKPKSVMDVAMPGVPPALQPGGGGSRKSNGPPPGIGGQSDEKASDPMRGGGYGGGMGGGLGGLGNISGMRYGTGNPYGGGDPFGVKEPQRPDMGPQPYFGGGLGVRPMPVGNYGMNPGARPDAPTQTALNGLQQTAINAMRNSGRDRRFVPGSSGLPDRRPGR